jgi:hypothetical protein
MFLSKDDVRSSFTEEKRDFDPSRNTLQERVKAETDLLLDQGKYIQHKWNLSFVKIGAM